jgi:hypothetical protein
VRWEEQQVTETMLATLREQLRIAQGRDPQPSAGIIDSQSVKGADTVGRDSRGYDAANYAGLPVMPIRVGDRLRRRDFLLAGSA